MALSSHGHTLPNFGSNCIRSVAVSCMMFAFLRLTFAMWPGHSVHKAPLTASRYLCSLNPSICCAAWRALTWTLWKDWAVILENVIMASPLRKHMSKSMGRSWPRLYSNHWKVIVQQVMWFCWICHCVKSLRKAEGFNNLQISSSLTRRM